jgi:hypothetical protein
VEEVVSSGPDRIIVYEGAEEKLKQLGSGLLEKLGIGGPSWEQEERERFRQSMVPVENQLASGQPSVQEQRRIQPASSRAVQVEEQEELEYVELERRRQEPMRQRRYLDEEDTYARPEERQVERWRDGGEQPYSAEPERGESYRGNEEAQLEPRPREREAPIQQRPPIRRPLSRSEEPLDVEPEPYRERIEEAPVRRRDPEPESIDDPW